MYRRYVHCVIVIVAMVLMLGAVASGQTPTTTDNPFPSRGFLPGTLVLESDAGDVSINSGNLNYRVPMYRFPGGPGSVPLDVGLVYNSFIYDADGYVNMSQSGGGWQYSFQYYLLQEPVPGACFGSSWGSSGVSTSIVFPDGSRHVLHFNGPSNYNVTFEGQVVCPVNTPPLTGSLNFFTVDGTYVRVQTTAGGSGAAPYKVFLPDGTQLEGSGTASPTKMTDRNGNVLTIVAASRTTPGDGTFLPTFIITDQVGRRIELSYTLDENNVPTDTITFSAPGLAERLTWTVVWRWYVASNPLPSTGGAACPNTTCETYPSIFGIKEISLPSVNGELLKYAFQYYIQENSDPGSLPGWGELRSVRTPYGATAIFEYVDQGLGRGFGTGTENVRVSKKTIGWSDPQNASRSQQWMFATLGDPGYPDSVNVTAPDGGITNYSFCGQQASYGNVLRGRICVVTKPNLDIVRTKWKYNCPLRGTPIGDPTPLENLFAAAEFISVNGSQGWKTSVRSYDYDRNGNLVQLKEWDWLTGAISTVPSAGAARITNNTYWLSTPSYTRDPDLGENCAQAADFYNAYWNSLSGGVLRARASTLIADDSFQNYSWSEFYYDNPLTTANLISDKQWRRRDNNGNSQSYSNPLSSANSITTSWQYGYGGALVQSTDANGVSTTFNINRCGFIGSDQATHYSMPGQVSRAVGTALERSTIQNWDCAKGLLTDSTDPNGVTTHTTYDPIGRVVQTVEGGTRTTNIRYNEASVPVNVTTSRTVNTADDNFQIRRLDQRGHVYQTQANDIYVDLLPRLAVAADGKSYEAVSNAHRTSGNGSDGWTRTTYDQLNRPIRIDHFDGSSLPYPWGTANVPTSFSTISYDGADTAFTDEAGQVRKQTLDAFDRVIQVQEDPGGKNYLTTYWYNPLGNLTRVIKDGQQDRTFVYDSLSRLYSATNPESGTTLYRYDANGNLIGKADARTVVTTITVDQLNRITSKSYTDATPPATPPVTYCYDGSTTGACTAAPTGTNLIDRLTMVSSSASASLYSAYSPFGEVLASRQVTDGPTYSFSYTYNNLGQLTSITYPSQRKVTTAYDAAGRATSMTSPNRTYANSVTYAPNGAVSTLTVGNGKLEQRCYNSRLQVVAIRVGASATDANCSAGSGDLLQLVYGFNVSQNNGNLASQTITRGANVWTQSYGYDGVNRLIGAQESGAGTWAQSYDYDAAGNRWVTSHTGTGMWGLTLETGTTSTWYSAAGTNRVNTWTYDNAGNVQHVGSMDRDFTYDAENRMTSATILGQMSTYSYDGDGRRVKAVSPAGTTIFVYDAIGRLAAEYGTTTSSSGTLYLTTDALGSTRLVMNATGQVSRNSDYLPFGEELGQGNGGAARDTTFSGNGTRQKFTGKERDAESGLDFFEARYFSGPQGRFTSPDPIFASAAHLADPQMWNLYSYARNNPLSITDPTGLDFYLICEHKEENQDICHEVQNDSQRAWVQGTTDSNGTFTPYRIANDANGNLVDINHGNPAFNGSFDQSGVYLSSANAIIVGTGQFINGSNETDVLGSGIFNGLVGRFVSDCGGSCQARGSLYELEPGSGALANAENTLNRRSGFATMIDLLSGAHASGPQWTDAQGRVHVIQNVTGVNAGKTELHFEGHPTGNVTGLALHMLDTIRDAVRGRAAAERNRSLP